jgi:ATP-dependent DNA helicase DinG
MKKRDFINKVIQMLSESGPLPILLPQFEQRTEQVGMAASVARAFEAEQILSIQAGTGVGKSFAYLIPAILWSVEHDETVVVSTATTNLQDQISRKDIPLLTDALDEKFTAVVVKGSQQYICLDRLVQAESSLPLSLNASEQKQLERIRKWAYKSVSGQRSELKFEPSPRLWREIEVSTTMCLYEKCQFFNSCTFIRDRKQISKAQLIITNHSLLMSDLILKSQSEGSISILPEYSRTVIDEAHKFESAVTDALSFTVNPVITRLLLTRIYNQDSGDGLLGKLHREIKHLPFDKGERTSFSRSLSKTEQITGGAIQSLTYLFDRILPEARRLVPVTGKYTVKQTYDDAWLRTDVITDIRDNELENFLEVLAKLSAELGNLQIRFTKTEESEEILRIKKELYMYRKQLDDLSRGLGQLFGEGDDDVRWIELPPSGDLLSFRSSPVSVDHFIGPVFFEQMKTAVLTSATLAPGHSFDFFHTALGLSAIERHRQANEILPSPFPFEQNALLLIPTDIPEPTAPSYQEFVNSIIPEAIRGSRGRALVLFTSHDMLQRTYDATAASIEAAGYECYAQGQHSKTIALENFRTNIDSVLFGTASFWDGIDVAGESLSLVIIVRIPFSVPNDPIIESRSNRMQEEGKNPFMEFQLPQAAMRLQQGFGRLIRSSTDKGVVLCLDKRIITKRYGRYILDSLPPCTVEQAPHSRLIRRIDEFLA